MTGSKNIFLGKTENALKELSSALSDCSAIINEKKIYADNKDSTYRQKLDEAQAKFDLLFQSSQSAINNINELTAQIDKVLD